MRVLVAGATGVVGRQLVPLLTAVGHTVIALAHSQRRACAGRKVHPTGKLVGFAVEAPA